MARELVVNTFVYFISEALHPSLAHFPKTQPNTTKNDLIWLRGAAPRRILRARPAPKSQRLRHSIGRDVRGHLSARCGPACPRVRRAALHLRPDTGSQQVALAVVSSDGTGSRCAKRAMPF